MKIQDPELGGEEKNSITNLEPYFPIISKPS
jgi:hypothetical protein